MKKALITISILLVSIILLFCSIVGLLHLPSVQTFIINTATSQLAEKLSIDVHVKQFHYRPLNRLTIDDIYISDQQKDTLAYIEQVELNFNPLKLTDKLLDIDQIRLDKPYLNLHKTSDSTYNYHFLLLAFEQDSSSFPLQLSIEQLVLEQTRLRYNEILIDQFDLALTLPILTQDSLDIYIESMHLRAQVDKFDAIFEANLHGSLDSIFANNMLLSFQSKQIFNGNIAVFHPTSLDSLSIQASCKQLYCDSTLLSNILHQLQLREIQIPQQIANLERVDYTGDISGRLKYMQLHGAFNTPLGTMNVNGVLQAKKDLQSLDFSGEFSTECFQIGKMLDVSDLGNIAFSSHIDGRIDSAKLKNCVAEANIQQIEYRGYNYQNIQLDGEWNINEMDGRLTIDDENIQLNISGLADWDQSDTRIDFVIQAEDLSPHALHFMDKNPDLRISTVTYISLYTSGSKEEMLDNMNGYVIFDSIKIQNLDKKHQIKQIKILIDNEMDETDVKRRLRIQSNLITGSLSGHYSYKTIPIAVQHILHENLPTLIEKPNQPYPEDIHLDFYTYLRRIDRLNRVLDIGYNIPSYPTIKGYIHNKELGVRASIPELENNSVKFEDITIALNNEDNHLNLSLYSLTHLPQNHPTAAKLGDIKTTFKAYAANDDIDLNIQLGNTDQVRNEGNISISSHISHYHNQPKFDIQIKPTNIILNDSVWSISPTKITYTQATHSTDIHNLVLNTDYQSIEAQGRISKEKKDSVNILLNNINLDYLLSYTEANKVISIQGPVTGNATLYNVLSGMMLEANAKIPSAGINGVYLGDVTAEARLDRANKSIILDGEVIDSTKHCVAIVKGNVIPKDKQWILDIDCDSIDVNFIDKWTNNLISNPMGRGYGHVRVEGKKRLVNVTGAVLAKDAQVTLPQIGVTYSFTDSIYLDTTAIRFPDIQVKDQYQNDGIFTGSVYHQYFTNIHYDLRAQANKLLVMDLPANQQSFFYGKVFGTGDVHIYGDDMDCNIDVTARTESNTKFYLNINSASQASQSNFIHFVQPDTTRSNGILNILLPKSVEAATPLQSKLRLSLQGEVTPQAEINILLAGEDAIKGKGEGNLKLVYETPSENIQMQGSYTLHTGNFSFSLGNIVRRNFTIREGSRITWDNDPLAPTVDITGHFHTTASLRDLFGTESAQIATNRTSVPVNCVLHMTDQLFDPILKFAIELPQSDESVQSQVSSMINTEEMLMRQIIYLLVFNRFYTPEYLQNTQNVGLNETYSLLSSTLTGQINSWLSKLTDMFTMGFNFRTDGEGETASQEYEANFQIHPINQLIINGNFGYRYNDLSNRPFFGDLDIEYLLTENGKLRIKAYTHTVDKYSLRQANMVQGVGLVFKHDFNWRDSQKDKSNSKKKANKSTKNKKKQPLDNGE